MSAAKLLLNGEGRYVQGPDLGKVQMMKDAGGVIRTGRRQFPIKEGWQLLAIVDNVDFEACLWVQDQIDFDRCVRTDDGNGRPVTWMEIENKALFDADRQPLKKRCASAESAGPVTLMRQRW